MTKKVLKQVIHEQFIGLAAASKPGASLFDTWPTQLEIVTLRFVTDRQVRLTFFPI